MRTLEVLQPGLAMVHGFANAGLAYGRGEVMAVDSGWRTRGADAVRAMRQITAEPVMVIIHTHGHLDHMSGTAAFLDDAAAHGYPRPVKWAHDRVQARQHSFTQLAGWNAMVNSLQFRLPIPVDRLRRGEDLIPPDVTYGNAAELRLAGEPVELYHARAETDDATWVWMPERRVAFVGDPIISSLPNAGNPTKRQRYTIEWAEALDALRAKRPEMVIPRHGQPTAACYIRRGSLFSDNAASRMEL